MLVSEQVVSKPANDMNSITVRLGYGFEIRLLSENREFEIQIHCNNGKVAKFSEFK